MSMYIPIFLYHHVVKSSANSDLAPFIIDESDFKWQLDMLADLGYTPITLKELLVTTDTTKKVVITFDDCPKNLLTHAIPHLENKKWKAVFFAPYDHLGGYNEWNVRKGKTKMELMTREEVKYLEEMGHEVGAHSMTHPHLNACPPDMVEYEINESKKQLDNLLENPVESFAYPYGHYPENYKAIMQKAGYKCAVAMDSQALTIQNDPYCVRRIVIEQGETPDTFKKKLSSFD